MNAHLAWVLNQRKEDQNEFKVSLCAVVDDGYSSVVGCPWRASLERPQDGQRLDFRSLEDLFAFLENETRLILPDSENPEAEGTKEGHYETEGAQSDEPRVSASLDELFSDLRERTDMVPARRRFGGRATNT